MSEISDRYRNVAARFTETARSVPADAWDTPAPCEGWVARDVVRHLVEWVPVPDDADEQTKLIAFTGRRP